MIGWAYERVYTYRILWHRLELIYLIPSQRIIQWNGNFICQEATKGGPLTSFLEFWTAEDRFSSTDDSVIASCLHTLTEISNIKKLTNILQWKFPPLIPPRPYVVPIYMTSPWHYGHALIWHRLALPELINMTPHWTIRQVPFIWHRLGPTELVFICHHRPGPTECTYMWQIAILITDVHLIWHWHTECSSYDTIYTCMGIALVVDILNWQHGHLRVVLDELYSGRDHGLAQICISRNWAQSVHRHWSINLLLLALHVPPTAIRSHFLVSRPDCISRWSAVRGHTMLVRFI